VLQGAVFVEVGDAVVFAAGEVVSVFAGEVGVVEAFAPVEEDAFALGEPFAAREGGVVHGALRGA